MHNQHGVIRVNFTKDKGHLCLPLLTQIVLVKVSTVDLNFKCFDNALFYGVHSFPVTPKKGRNV